jgi:hypothetical protein
MEKARTTGGRFRRVSRRVVLRRLDVGGLATGLTLGTPAPPAATQEPSPPSVPPILEVWAAAWSAEDLDRLVALYIDDAVFEDVAAASKSTARPTSEPCSRPASGPSPASGRGCLRGSGRRPGGGGGGVRGSALRGSACDPGNGPGRAVPVRRGVRARGRAEPTPERLPGPLRAAGATRCPPGAQVVPATRPLQLAAADGGRGSSRRGRRTSCRRDGAGGGSGLRGRLRCIAAA